VAQGERIQPLVEDVSERLRAEMRRGGNLLFEGAQGALLDNDVGTYPFVTSSNTIAGAAAVGTGLGPRDMHRVLGIVKAYTTRVGAGPFPTETVRRNRRAPVARRPRVRRSHRATAPLRLVRRRGAAARGAAQQPVEPRRHQLDVLDGLDTLQICTGYRIDGEVRERPPLLPHRFSECEPVYETHPGWKEPSIGITDFAQLPDNARRYLARLEHSPACRFDIVSTGPDRAETIVLRHPFD